MRNTSFAVTFTGLVVIPFLAACNGCGPSYADRTAVKPAPSGGVEVSNAAIDEEHEEPEVGAEGEDDTPPPDPLASAKRPPGPGSTALADEASRQLGIMKASVYSHKTHIDEAHGSFDYDCSGFLDYALGRAAPDAFADLRKASVKRPLAKHFVNFFASIPERGHIGRWHRVARAADLVPGDVVAWLRPSDSTSKNSGHVMIVRGAIGHDMGHPDTFDVPVVDSTSARHGKGDSRAVNTTGLGTGSIVLVVDGSGAPIHYRWTRGKSREHASTITLAHLD